MRFIPAQRKTNSREECHGGRAGIGRLLRGPLWPIGFALLAGCAASPPIVHKPVELPLPPRPTLPPVAATAVRCLSDRAYSDLVQRERLLRTWGLKLQAIIRQNNAHARKTGGKP